MMPMHLTPPQAEMEAAFLGSDASYDGLFFTAVRTTGIFCRPSCRARKPRPENVEFFATEKQALFAGYRPCMRCRPMESAGSGPDWVRRLMEAVEAAPERRLRDADLRAMDIEPARARRYFLDRYGMTFQAYSRARRLAAAFTEIREGGGVDDAVFDSGYESHSGFRDAFARTFGHTPVESRHSDCIVMSWVETPIGPMVSGATARGVCLLEFSDRRMIERQLSAIRKRFRCAAVPGENPHLEELHVQLMRYFAGEQRDFTLPLDTSGTPFEERVWTRLREIPYGQTWSYEDLARSVGNPAAVRAVARANGSNRIAILIPCHRVVNKNGELGGYGGGVWRKTALLEHERGVRIGAASPARAAVLG